MFSIDPLPLPKARRPTYHFLQYARRYSPVYLSTEVAMDEVVAHRVRSAGQGQRTSYVAYVIQAIAQVIRRYPDANASVSHGLFPRVAYTHHVHAKFTMDKRVEGRRVVVPGLIPDVDQLTLEAIQARLEYLREGSVEVLPEFKGARMLRSLPMSLGRLLYGLALSNLRKRPALQGTFTVTSLGHRPIDNFFPIISSTTCFGVGAIAPKPAVVDGALAVRQTMTLNMAFDHSAIDGAMAADLLAEVKEALETGSEFDSNQTRRQARGNA